jgi:biopolymer transport protein TolR
MSEINVTPMVDVMLVLLVIFMITAPLLSVGVPVNLPKTAAPPISGSDEPLVISIDARGRVYVQETETRMGILIARLRAIADNKSDIRILVRGDKTVPYGRILEVMGMVSAAGYSKVGLVAELPGSAVANQAEAR